MIAKLQISGLGPYQYGQTLDLAGMGSSTIRGPSEKGKTMVIDAVCFVLFGYDRTGKPLDVAAINDDAKEVEVVMTLATGAVIRRVLRRNKDGKRGETIREFRGVPYDTEKAFLGELKGLGAAPKKVMQLLVPLAWQPLASGAGGGRPLRNMLASILPKASMTVIVKRLMVEAGFGFRTGDPINPKDAEMVRRRANTKRDECSGHTKGMRELVEVGKATQPLRGAPDKVTAAHSVVALAEEWSTHLAALDVWTNTESRIGKQVLERDAWDKRKHALGEKPDGDASAADEPRAALEALRTEMANHSINLGRGTAAVESAERALEEAKVQRHPEQKYADRVNAAKREHSDAIAAQKAETGVCPHCERPDWKGAVKAAKERVKNAEIADMAATSAQSFRVEEIRREQEDEKNEAFKKRNHTIDALTARKQAGESFAADLKKAEAAVAAASGGAAAVSTWEMGTAALGTRPTVDENTERPTAPTKRAPKTADTEAARQAIEAHKKAVGAAEQQQRNLERAEDALQGAEEELYARTQEAERLDALVDAVRRAPSVAAREQMGALGDLGPVELVLTKKGGVDVRIDGRPWYLASTGRLVVADAFLRAGLRRAMKLGYCPLFIDQIQSVKGQPIPDFSPAILLETVDMAGIEVVL